MNQKIKKSKPVFQFKQPKVWALVFMVTLLVTQNIQAENKIMQDPRLEDFIGEIGFDKLPKADDAIGIAFAWDSLGKDVLIWNTSWSLSGSDTTVRSKHIHRSLALQGRQSNDLDIWQHTNAMQAREHFLDLASRTTMMKIPYKKVKDRIGDSAVGSFDDSDERIIFCNGAVSVQLTVYGEPGEALPIARKLDKVLTEHRVKPIATYLPKITSLASSKMKAHVGETINIVTAFEPPAKGGECAVEIMEPMASHLSEKGFTKDGFAFEAVKEGKATVAAVVYDKKTLLFDVRTIELTIEK